MNICIIALIFTITKVVWQYSGKWNKDYLKYIEQAKKERRTIKWMCLFGLIEFVIVCAMLGLLSWKSKTIHKIMETTDNWLNELDNNNYGAVYTFTMLIFSGICIVILLFLCKYSVFGWFEIYATFSSQGLVAGLVHIGKCLLAVIVSYPLMACISLRQGTYSPEDIVQYYKNMKKKEQQDKESDD